jgi:imidazolonepropionase-like amidohydrolase
VPKIQWTDLPDALRKHLLQRLKERKIPGESLHQELELLVSAGLTPGEVLRSAPRNGARALGREADFGTIEPGRRADLVVLTRDPLVRIEDTRSIERVMQGGRWVGR